MLSKCEILNCVCALHGNYKMDIQIELQCHILTVHVLNVYIYVHKCDGIFGTDTLHWNRTQNVHLKWDKINWLSLNIYKKNCVIELEIKPPEKNLYVKGKLFTKSTIGLQTPWHLSIVFFFFILIFFFIKFFFDFICKIFIFDFDFVHFVDA